MIETHFSTAAKTYDQHSRPQQALIDKLAEGFPTKTPSRILELGCGTGQLTRRLIDRYPNIPIDASDISPGMIEYCRGTFPDQSQISWIIADAQTYAPETVYPLIVSSSALHWTAELKEMFSTIHQNLKPGGTFALGMMLEGTLRELRELRTKIAPQKVFGTQLPTFGKTEETLLQVGFSIHKTECFDQRFTYANASAFLNAIHEQGVTGGSLEQGYIPLTRSEMKQLLLGYQKEYAAGDNVYASYETAVFIATKK